MSEYVPTTDEIRDYVAGGGELQQRRADAIEAGEDV